ncbi:MAG TPA: ABC transporter permease [Candidatus Limnocylindrales bacterium]|nr:ABC transporter permease [Candidatus Limnocylindrales bacterium]
MSWITQIFSRRRVYDDLSADIRSHLEERADELMKSGMSRKEAAETALREFGNATSLEQSGREVWRWSFLENSLMDVRYGLRVLRKNPGFTAASVLTLALGIGANTAIFTILNSVLLSNLPVKNPQQLVLLTNPDEHGRQIGFGDGERDLLTYPEFQDLSARNQVFDGILAADSYIQKQDVSIGASGESESGSDAQIGLVSGSYFSVLGVNPILGRIFTTEVDRVRDANPVAVISYGFWQSRFGGDPSVIGKKIRLLSTTYDVIGVTPAGFVGETVGYSTDIWLPLTMQAEAIPGRDYLSMETNPFEKREWLQVMGRLKPGVSLAQANSSINLLFQQYLKAQTETGMSADQKRTFMTQRIAMIAGGRGASTLQAKFGQPLQILMGVVGLVLLIACANVANLLLARAASRQREIAVRVAMGAGAGRLFRQVLTESVLLAGIGGAFGLLIARWADSALLRLVSGGRTPVPLDVHLNAAVLTFTLGVSMLTGILFGLVPALRASRAEIGTIIKGTSRGVVGGAGHRSRMTMGKVLVVVQVTLSLLLLVAAGLFVRSFQKLSEVNLGYDRDHLLVFRVMPTTYGYRGPALNQLYKNMLDRIAALPGVRSVSLSEDGLITNQDSNDPVSIEGQPPKVGDGANDSRSDQVGPNYFSTTGIPILMGREIGPQDSGNAERVGLINQTFARHFYGDSNPIGTRVSIITPAGHEDFVVVGVVADAKYHSMRDKPSRRFYIPFFNPMGNVGGAFVIVREAGNSAAMPASLREIVKQSAPNLPALDISTMNEIVDDSLTVDRMVTKLSGVFGGLAIVLSCIGIYGIMAYSVAGRTNEIGIRMALGAQRGAVLWMVLRESLLLVLIGVAIGLPAVVAAGRLITSLLFGITPADPLALFLATGLMFLIGALASYIPANRAMRIDPMMALRYE